MRCLRSFSRPSPQPRKLALSDSSATGCRWRSVRVKNCKRLRLTGGEYPASSQGETDLPLIKARLSPRGSSRTARRRQGAIDHVAIALGSLLPRGSLDLDSGSNRAIADRFDLSNGGEELR